MAKQERTKEAQAASRKLWDECITKRPLPSPAEVWKKCMGSPKITAPEALAIIIPHSYLYTSKLPHPDLSNATLTNADLTKFRTKKPFIG